MASWMCSDFSCMEACKKVLAENVFSMQAQEADGNTRRRKQWIEGHGFGFTYTILHLNICLQCLSMWTKFFYFIYFLLSIRGWSHIFCHHLDSFKHHTGNSNQQLPRPFFSLLGHSCHLHLSGSLAHSLLTDVNQFSEWVITMNKVITGHDCGWQSLLYISSVNDVDSNCVGGVSM